MQSNKTQFTLFFKMFKFILFQIFFRISKAKMKGQHFYFLIKKIKLLFMKINSKISINLKVLPTFNQI
jgi:hypothetical protein